MASRLQTALLGLLLSLLISAAVWYYTGSPFAFLFLFLPFVPFSFGGGEERSPVRTCPECGFRTRDPSFAYCPRDGRALRER